MEKYKKITREFGVGYLLQALLLLSGFFVFPILTRMLSVKDYGFYSLILISIFLVVGIMNMGLNRFIERDLTGKSEKYKLRSFSSMNSFYVFIIFLASLLFLIFFKLNTFIDSFLLVYLFFSVIFAYYSMLLISYIRSRKELIKSNFFTYLLGDFWYILIIVYAFIFKTFDISTLFLLKAVLLFVSISILLIFIDNKRMLFKFNINKQYILKGLKFGLPFLPLLIAQWVITASDRYLIKLFNSNLELGFYSFIYTLVALISISGRQIITTLNIYIVEAYNKKDSENSNFLINASIKYSFMIVIPAIIGLLILGQEIITLIAGTKYLPALFLLPILVTYPIFRMINLNLENILFLKKDSIGISKIYLFGMTFNLTLNFLLIPKFSILGAAISTIITYILMSIIFIWKTKSDLLLNWNFLKPFRLIFSVFIMGFSILFITPETMIYKLLTILFAIFIYFSMLFISGFFVKEEKLLIKKMLKL